MHHDIHSTIEDFWRDTQSRYLLLRGDSNRPLLAPRDLFLTAEDFFAHSNYTRVLKFNFISMKKKYKVKDISSQLPSIRVNRHASNPTKNLAKFILEFTLLGGRILILAESLGDEN